MNTPDAFYVHIALWSQVVASVLFVGVLGWMWVKFIQPAILAAQDRYNKQIAEAERHRDEAKATLDLLKTQINGASHDAGLIKERADAQAKREYESAVSEARDAGERALNNARGELDRARAAAREQLREELLDKALDRARAEAERRIDASANARLVDAFVASLERANG